MNKSLGILLMCLLPICVRSQTANGKVEQLESQLSLAKNYQDSIKALRALAWHYMRHDLKLAEKFTLAFQVAAKQKKDDHTVAVSKHYLGLIKRSEGNYAPALALFKEALTSYQSDPNRKPSQLGALFNLGVINQEIGDYGKALEYLYQEHDLAKELNIKRGRANTLNSIGITFKKTGDYSKAIEIYDKAIPLAIEEGDFATQSNLLSNRAVVKADMGDFEGAIVDNLASLALDQQDGYEKGVAASYQRLAQIYLKKGEVAQALTYARSCFDLTEGTGFKMEIIQSKLLMAEAYFANLDFSTAKHFADMAFRDSEEMESVQMMRDSKKVLANIYARTDHFEKAYQAQLDLQDFDDQLGELEQIALVKNLEIRHEVSEQQHAFEKLQSESEIRANDLLKQKKLRSVLVIALLLAVCTIILVSRILSLRLFAEKLRSERNAIRQEQELQQALANNKMTQLNAMIKGQELERTRIAKDLHDGLGGLLSTVKIHFLTAQQEINALSKLIPFGKATNMLDEACDEVRRIAHNMMPDALEQFGLPVVIQDLSQALEEKGFDVHTQLLEIEDRLPEELEINLYRIIQELINNIVKYAKANKIIIQLSKDHHHVFLTVEDDGIGFDPYVNYTGIGLQNIRSRVDFLSGEIDINSSDGNGTSVFISLPISN